MAADKLHWGRRCVALRAPSVSHPFRALFFLLGGFGHWAWATSRRSSNGASLALAGQWEFSPSPQGCGGEARCVCGRGSACVARAEVGVIWRATISALAQAANRAGKTGHRCAAMRPIAQAPASSSRHAAPPCPCSECPRPPPCVCARESRGPLAQWTRRRPPEPESPDSSLRRVNALASRLAFPLRRRGKRVPLRDSSQRPPRG
jgi:hypothetical protein